MFQIIKIVFLSGNLYLQIELHLPAALVLHFAGVNGILVGIQLPQIDYFSEIVIVNNLL